MEETYEPPREEGDAEDIIDDEYEAYMEESAEMAYTYQAMLDGPDEWFYVTHVEDGSPAEQLSTIHIVPCAYGASMPEDIDETMMAAVAEGFSFDGELSNHTGTIKIFFDRAKEHLMTQYEMLNGQPYGDVVVMNHKGDTLIERYYDETKGWIEAKRSLACVNWTFDQAESSLMINDLPKGETKEDSTRVIRMMSSMWSTASFHEDLYKVMEKESFKKPFKVNHFPYTGKLMAYFKPKSYDLKPYFELNFKFGLLHDTIRVYNDWGQLALEEVFIEGQLDTTLHVLEYEDGVAKPVIYLYPEEEMKVNVQLDFDGTLTHTYPKYKDGGWNITADPDGRLSDENGREYYSLYWEGDNRLPFHLNEGNVIEGSKTIEFLENSLKTLGLTDREANEFIIYWLPRMEGNAYNLIHFSTEEYDKMAKLDITPKPETIIRVMMVFQPLDDYQNCRKQDLDKLAVSRSGFTVVEWGGKELPGEI